VSELELRSRPAAGSPRHQSESASPLRRDQSEWETASEFRSWNQSNWRHSRNWW
jgi:hypothetical protein